MSASTMGRRLSIGLIAEIHHGEPPADPVRWHNELSLDRTAELLDQAVATLREMSPDAVVLLGDLSNYADGASLAHVAKTVAALERPVYVVPGNHDIDGHPDAAERFSRPLSLPGVVVAPAIVEPEAGLLVPLVGLRRDAETNALSSACPALLPAVMSRLTIIQSHFPLLPMSERLASAGLRHAGDLADRENLLHMVEQVPGPVIAMHGHLHVRASQSSGALLQLSCAALVEPPHEITIMTVTESGDSQFMVKRTAISIKPHIVRRVPVLSPAEEEWRFAGGRWSSITG
ncbi:hypothetical protein BH23CHL5_BH23CHL5_17960 [soil metagenome]